MSRWCYRLHAYERRVAVGVAKLRGTDRTSNRNRSADQSEQERLAIDIPACIAEVASARMLNLCWTGMAKQQADVGGVIEVRAIRSPGHCLTARGGDADTSPGMLVYVDEDYVCHALGWQMFGYVRKNGRRMVGGGTPYHLLAKEQLRAMDELLPWVWVWQSEQESA